MAARTYDATERPERMRVADGWELGAARRLQKEAEQEDWIEQAWQEMEEVIV